MYKARSFAETGFPAAVGLKYQDGNNEAVLLLERQGKYIPPPDGWSRPGRVYIPQEISVTDGSSGKYSVY